MKQSSYNVEATQVSVAQAQSWFEIAYYISGIALVLVAALGLRQITVLKKTCEYGINVPQRKRLSSTAAAT
jgi:hypothetical protein